MASTALSGQAKAWSAGPTTSAASVTRPVTTTCAPAARASAIARAAKYAFAVTTGAPSGSGSPVSRLTNSSLAAGNLAHGVGQALRVESARVGDDRDAALDAGREHVCQFAQEGAGIAPA